MRWGPYSRSPTASRASSRLLLGTAGQVQGCTVVERGVVEPSPRKDAMTAARPSAVELDPNLRRRPHAALCLADSARTTLAPMLPAVVAGSHEERLGVRRMTLVEDAVVRSELVLAIEGVLVQAHHLRVVSGIRTRA